MKGRAHRSLAAPILNNDQRLLHTGQGRFLNLPGESTGRVFAYDAPDSHLVELMVGGVSYLVSPTGEIDVSAMLEILNTEFGIKRILLESGAVSSSRRL